jgi:hypothetical protein
MKLNLGTICLLAVCGATLGAAAAQTISHDRMDARSARADIRRLKRDRRHALKTNNMGKVAQDDRLIAADRHFVRKDVHKVIRSGG